MEEDRIRKSECGMEEDRMRKLECGMRKGRGQNAEIGMRNGRRQNAEWKRTECGSWNAENKKRRRRHTPNFLIDVSSRTIGSVCMGTNLILFVLVNQSFTGDEFFNSRF
jgi:hypothetical protein